MPYSQETEGVRGFKRRGVTHYVEVFWDDRRDEHNPDNAGWCYRVTSGDGIGDEDGGILDTDDPWTEVEAMYPETVGVATLNLE